MRTIEVSYLGGAYKARRKDGEPWQDAAARAIKRAAGSDALAAGWIVEGREVDGNGQPVRWHYKTTVVGRAVGNGGRPVRGEARVYLWASEVEDYDRMREDEVGVWYRYTAHNAPTVYGYSDRRDRAAIAAAYLERLNRGREVGVYVMEALSGEADQWDENIARALRNDDIAFNGYTTLDDVQIGRGAGWNVGDRVEGGDNAEDYDTGRVLAVSCGDVTVGWDSGVRTTQPSDLLRREGEKVYR